MGLWFVQYVCVVPKWHCCIGAFVYMWSICVSLIVVFFMKMSFKLYVFMNACNVDDWFVFVKKSILKSPIIIVGQCEGIFCIMLSRI
jgi:hypothetical protein